MTNAVRPRNIAVMACLLAAILNAQQNRITGRIDNSQRVTLPGNVHPDARPQFDRGAVEPAFQVPSITMYLKPSAAQQSALDQTLANQQNPASPNYHKWLTPEQYADQFGVSQSDVNKIVAWLESQGFTIDQVARGRNFITFSGTAQQVQNAFGTQIHRYEVNGKLHYANATDPSVPAALSNLVSGFHGLNDFRLKPRSMRRSANPNETSGGVHQMAPDDFATIYDVTPLYQAGINGTGQKLVVVGQTAINTSDIQAFRSKFNLPAINLTQVLAQRPSPGISQDDLPEADLDLEWSGAVARDANIIFVYSSDVFTSLSYAIDQDLAPVISMSYGLCEPSDLVDLPNFQSMAKQGNAQGITWLAASGDSGAADCEDMGAAIAQNGLAVDAPGSIPEVTSMGGTQFNEQGGSYWSATNTANDASALAYIPEMVWNTTAIEGRLAAGGGGASIFFPQPVWQTGQGVPNDGARHVPDLALNASPDHDGYIVYTGGTSQIFGGTSVAAPTMAGIVTLLNEYLVSTGAESQPGVGNINPTLYRLAQNVPGVFHDVTSGNNIVPCAIGSPGCVTGTYGYSASAGYDQASGLGSPDANNFVHQWSNAKPTATAVVMSINANPVFQSGSRWPFTITLTEEAGVGTTLTSFSINGTSYDIATTFGSTSIAADGSVSSKNLSLSGLSVPTNVNFALSGVDANGQSWSEQMSIPFVGPQTQLTVGGASNAASGQQTYAPGMLLSVYGTQLGNFAQSAATIPLPDFLAGFSAMINGVPTPLYYVSPGQVNLQIPYETPTGQVALVVDNPYQESSLTLNVVEAAPGIFMSNGFVSAPFSSASAGQATTLFITGEGQVTPSLADGTSPPAGTPLTRLPKPVLPVTVTVAGQQATIQFIGIPSGLVGVTQINYVVPASVPLGVQQVVVTVGGVQSPPVQLNVTQ